MRFVLAPDAYKGSLTALEVAAVMEEAIVELLPTARVDKIPMADGGEGTVDAMLAGAGGKKYYTAVTGPMGEAVEAFYGLLSDGTAVLEMAAASGLPLVPPAQRNPWLATTYGTGELIKTVLDRGSRRMILGLGGSATNDGGLGLAQALGIRFLDAQGQALGGGGGELLRLARIDPSGLDPRVRETELLVACDVDNPLVGPQGATRIFGPQKGATPAMVEELEAGLEHLGDIILRDLGREIRAYPGGGAAGGLGAGLLVFLGARLLPGFTLIAEACGLATKIAAADLVLTGEGRTDAQTKHGKTPLGVARLASRHRVPVMALVGAVEGDMSELYAAGLTGICSIVPGPMSLETAMEQAPHFLKQATGNLMRCWLSGAGR